MKGRETCDAQVRGDKKVSIPWRGLVVIIGKTCCGTDMICVQYSRLTWRDGIW